MPPHHPFIPLLPVTTCSPCGAWHRAKTAIHVSTKGKRMRRVSRPLCEPFESVPSRRRASPRLVAHPSEPACFHMYKMFPSETHTSSGSVFLQCPGTQSRPPRHHRIPARVPTIPSNDIVAKVPADEDGKNDELPVGLCLLAPQSNRATPAAAALCSADALVGPTLHIIFRMMVRGET